MFKFLGGRSKDLYVEQARTLRCEPAALKAIADGLLEAGNTFTLVNGHGGMHVYPGDFTSGASASGGPVLILEYKKRHHTAYVKSGSGEVLMMLVREKSEDAWFDQTRRYIGFGSQTEGHLYLNGTPVGVNYSDVYCDVAPKVSSEERAQTGASLVELLKEKHGRGIQFFRRKGNGEKGKEVCAFTRIKQGTSSVCVFSLQDAATVDPVVTLVMAWFAGTVDMGHAADPLAKDVASI